MNVEPPKCNAVSVLHKRYVAGDAVREAALQRERQLDRFERSLHELAAETDRLVERVKITGKATPDRAFARKTRVCHCGSGKRWLKCCWPRTAD